MRCPPAPRRARGTAPRAAARPAARSRSAPTGLVECRAPREHRCRSVLARAGCGAPPIRAAQPGRDEKEEPLHGRARRPRAHGARASPPLPPLPARTAASGTAQRGHASDRARRTGRVAQHDLSLTSVAPPACRCCCCSTSTHPAAPCSRSRFRHSAAASSAKASSSASDPARAHQSRATVSEEYDARRAAPKRELLPISAQAARVGARAVGRAHDAVAGSAAALHTALRPRSLAQECVVRARASASDGNHEACGAGAARGTPRTRRAAPRRGRVGYLGERTGPSCGAHKSELWRAQVGVVESTSRSCERGQVRLVERTSPTCGGRQVRLVEGDKSDLGPT